MNEIITNMSRTAASSENAGTIKNLFAVIEKEWGNFKLDVGTLRNIGNALDVDEKDAAKWTCISDILSHIDIGTLANNNPDLAKKIACFVLTAISFTVPVLIPITAVVALLPEKAVAMLMAVCDAPTPKHIAYRIARHKADKAQNKLLRESAV